MTKRNILCGIYCIENTINNKKYLGKSTDIYTRWVNHKRTFNKNVSVNKKMQNSWNKYGEHSFIFYVLEECSFEILDEREKYWINFYDSFNSGYNLTIGGEGTSGYKLSEETKIKMSIWQRDGKSPNFGKPMAEEIKAKISLSSIGRIVSSETREKMSNSGIGRKNKNSSSKYYGVTYNNDKRAVKRWRMNIFLNGKSFKSKSYETEIEAAIAYDECVMKNNLKNFPINFK